MSTRRSDNLHVPEIYRLASGCLTSFRTCRCQSLYYKPANVTDCKHCFCKACISRFQDCPLCGIDISGVAEYPEMAGKAQAPQELAAKP